MYYVLDSKVFWQLQRILEASHWLDFRCVVLFQFIYSSVKTLFLVHIKLGMLQIPIARVNRRCNALNSFIFVIDFALGVVGVWVLKLIAMNGWLMLIFRMKISYSPKM